MRWAVTVEAERTHAPRVVAHALQRQPERRARHPHDRQIGQRRAAKRQIVERHRLAPVDAEQGRRDDVVEAGVAVEDRVVLAGEVEERRSDRQRDHDRVDALGANREGADQRSKQGRDQDRERDMQPPRPAQADLRHAAGAEDRHHVAGKRPHRHLDQAHHPAIAGQHHQRQGDHPEDEAPAEDLEQHEVAGQGRHQQQQQADRPDRRRDPLQHHQPFRCGCGQDVCHVSAGPREGPADGTQGRQP